MTQRQGLYFDTKAESAVADIIGGIGLTLTSSPELIGMGGLIGGMLGSPALGPKALRAGGQGGWEESQIKLKLLGMGRSRTQITE
jgi:hypothetical protein